MNQDMINQCKQAMDKRVKAFENDLKQTRTGRASVTILDQVRVDYYGTPTPLNQVATLSTPDARTIAISPFEKKLIGDIEKAIRVADIGVNPTNDGQVIRLPFPALTEERRKEIVKTLKKQAEDVKVGLRLVRRDMNEEIKKLEKDKKMTEDDRKRLEAEIQKQTDSFCKVVDDKTAQKEKEIMTV